MVRRITVIVPVRNEAAAIEQTLMALLEQDYPRDLFEVIVADGQSEDETVAIVRQLQDRYPNLRLHFNPRRYSSGARNLGIRQGTGDVMLIVDGHCTIPTNQYLKNVDRAFEESNADCLGRPQPLNVQNATLFQRCLALARSSKLGHNPDSDIYSNVARWTPAENVAVAYKREVFEKVGLFDERFDACEDVEFNTRIDRTGLKCYFTPDILVQYHPRASLGGLFRQMARYGAGRCRLGRKHPHSLTVPALIPAAWLGWLVLGLVLSILWPAVAVVYVASLVLYAGAIVGGSLLLSRQLPGSLGRLPWVFVAIHAGFGWGFLREMWKGSSRNA